MKRAGGRDLFLSTTRECLSAHGHWAEESFWTFRFLLCPSHLTGARFPLMNSLILAFANEKRSISSRTSCPARAAKVLLHAATWQPPVSCLKRVRSAPKQRIIAQGPCARRRRWAWVLERMRHIQVLQQRHMRHAPPRTSGMEWSVFAMASWALAALGRAFSTTCSLTIASSTSPWPCFFFCRSAQRVEPASNSPDEVPWLRAHWSDLTNQFCWAAFNEEALFFVVVFPLFCLLCFC